MNKQQKINPQQFLSKSNISKKGYYLSKNMYLMFYEDEIEITDSHIGLILRARIIKNNTGIWGYDFRFDKNSCMPFNDKELRILANEIKKFNEYECRKTKDFFKKNNVKKLNKYSQISMLEV